MGPTKPAFLKKGSQRLFGTPTSYKNDDLRKTGILPEKPPHEVGVFQAEAQLTRGRASGARRWNSMTTPTHCTTSVPHVDAASLGQRIHPWTRSRCATARSPATSGSQRTRAVMEMLNGEDNTVITMRSGHIDRRRSRRRPAEMLNGEDNTVITMRSGHIDRRRSRRRPAGRRSPRSATTRRRQYPLPAERTTRLGTANQQ